MSLSSTPAAASTQSAIAATLPNLHLTLGWNNQTYDVPPPAMLPDAMRQTREFRQWETVGDVRTLTWLAGDGTRYDAQCMGMVIDPVSKQRTPMIQRISRFRPDGTNERGLAVMRVASGGGQVISAPPRSFGGSGI